jgi:hypothetical protein
MRASEQDLRNLSVELHNIEQEMFDMMFNESDEYQTKMNALKKVHNAKLANWHNAKNKTNR